MCNWKKHYFFRFTAELLIILMVFQGAPLLELSKSIQWNPPRYIDFFKQMVSFVSPGEALAQSTTAEVGTIFGPKKYVRTTGKPNIYIDDFTIPGEGTTAALVITNDDDLDNHRITSAVIRLNGEQLFAPRDFNPKVTRLEIPVNLVKSNTLYIELRSKPEGYLTIHLEGHIPEADDQTITTEEDTPVDIVLTGSDVDGDQLTFSVTTAPSHGDLSGVPPTLTYTPHADYNGIDSFNFIANDGALDSQSATVTVTVTPVNDLPQANNDTVSLDEDTDTIIHVLANDFDVDGDTLSVTEISQPSNGTAKLNPDNTILYTPSPDFYGNDSFTYTISDGNGGIAVASVAITVKPVNDPPVIISDAITTVASGEEYIYDVEAVDPDNDPITYSLLEGPSCMDIDPDTGLITWPCMPDPDFEFAFNVATGGGQDVGYGVATDCEGNSFVTGFFKGTADFDPGPATYSLTSNGNSADIYIAKFDPYGNLLWAHSMGSSLEDQGMEVATDRNGDVYITGHFQGTVDFDPGPGTRYLTASGLDTFVCKFDRDGNFKWAENVDATSYSDGARDIVLDSVGNVYVTGSFFGTVDFDPGPDTYLLTSTGSYDIFVLKLDNSGNFLWAANAGGQGSSSAFIEPNYGHGLAVDSSDNVLITGWFVGTSDFDPGPDIYTMTSTGDEDIFVWKLTSTGDFIWARRAGSGQSDWGIGLAADDADNVYVTGGFTNTADFDPGPGVFELTDGGGFVWKLDSGGNLILALNYNGPSGNVSGYRLALDQYSNIYISGGFGGTVDFDPGENTAYRTAAGKSDGYISKFDSDGKFISVHILTGVATARGNWVSSMDLDPLGNMLITGEFNSTPLTFDSGNNIFQIYAEGGDSASNSDGFLIKYKATEPGPIPVAVRAEDDRGGSDTQHFAINIEVLNNPPVITSTPVTSGTVGQLYEYDVEATDPDGDTLTYSLTTAPAGMTIDPATGLIQWTPSGDQVGDNEVTVSVEDTSSLSDSQSFQVNVANVTPINNPPVITSTPVFTAAAGQLYTYDVEATDPDGDSLTYNLTTAPAGMTIDPATGLIQWIPTSEQVGDNVVTVKVEDPGGLFDSQDFTVIVANVDYPPEIISQPVTSATEGQLYTYDVEATDPDGDTLTYSLTTAPAGMTIDPATGLIQWTPSGDQVGDNEVTVSVEDTSSLSDSQSFQVNVANVTPINNPPVITSTPVLTAAAGQLYTYDVEAYDPDPGDLLTYSLDFAPSGMTIDSKTGLIQWTPADTDVDTREITVRVADDHDAWVTQSFPITVYCSSQPPEINSIPSGYGTVGHLYTYDVDASDPEGDTITYSLNTAPAGMTIDFSSGLIEWLPREGDIGSHDIEIKAEGRCGIWTTQGYILEITANQPPVIISPPVTTGSEGVLYLYDVDATDPENDTLSYSLINAPAGVNIDLANGLIQWLPSFYDAGSYDVEILVEDGYGGQDSQKFTITIEDVPLPPQISPPLCPPTATVGTKYTCDIDAIDPDGDTLTYLLTIAPEGMTIDSESGLIEWTPTNEQIGENEVSVCVEDPDDLSACLDFIIPVFADPLSPDYIRPAVTISVTPESVNVSGTVLISVIASDNVGVVNTSLFVNETPVSLDEDGNATYTSSVPGIFTAEGLVYDEAGNEGSATKEFRFLATGDGIPPTVAITSPVDLDKISVPTDIIGSAFDETQLVRYVLEYSEKGKNEFTRFASSDLPVTDGILGQLDPTQLVNGLYDIRLSAEDAAGNPASVTRTYQIEGEMKVGNFTIGFRDLSIPVAGLPVSINRTYDSRVKTSGDFGVGWSLDVKTIKLEETEVPGEGWSIVCKTSVFGTCIEWTVAPSTQHSVIVSMEGTRQQEFIVQAITSYADQSVAQGYLAFAAQPGTFSKLAALDPVSYEFISDGNLVDYDFSLIDPDRYRLTTNEGNIYIIDQESGVESIIDLNGNSITFGEDGIIHSAGKSVIFSRDAEGRITQITDPMGNVITYQYDFYGDLVAVTDQEGNTTRFTYNARHDLIDIIDPRGITPARNEYDDDGRLIATTDANGNRVEFTHNIGTRQEVITDRLGYITVYEYDDDGNVVSQTNALGNTTSYTYDDRGNKLTETDPLGNTATYTYDERDNMLSQTDALGNITTHTYNSRNQVLTSTDSLGNVTVNTYDANGNLLTTTDALGNTTANTYDAYGNLLTTTDCMGNVTSHAYDASGNLISQIDALGNKTTYTYDANGNQISQTTSRTNEDGVVVTMTTTNVYDSLNRVIKTFDPDGNETITEYNALGKQSATRDKNGNWTTYEYDDLGNLYQTTYPDGTTDTSSYDANGNRISSTNRDGNTTHFVYDQVNRLIQTIFPDDTPGDLTDNPRTQTQYDAAGRTIESIDERGNMTSFVYDAVGRRIKVIDALGNQTSFFYDANGNQSAITDANGNTTSFEYDALNRQIRTIFPDTTFTNTGYDCLGRKIFATDQAGVTTGFAYDALGRLITVIDALGGQTFYGYDEAGNKISQTDANDNNTLWAYDNLGRQTKHTLPLGMSETFTYDANGNMQTKTDFNSYMTTFTYDSCCNRLLSINYTDGSQVSFTYTPGGLRETVTDSRGTTTNTYDARNRLLQVTNPDGASLMYTYDETGNRTSVSIPSGTTIYAFDSLNRLSSVTDPNGGVTAYTYDAVGKRASVTYPNGTVAKYTYNNLNRLTYLENSRSDASIISSYTYTLGPNGNRIKVVEDNGRTVDYSYDSLYRLTGEMITDPVLGNETISYTYDPVGNRLTKTDSDGTTSYSYDGNDRLLSEDGNTYTYDANGNTLSKSDGINTTTYTYDFENRLTDSQTPTATISYKYDVDGIRVSSTVDGGATAYLVDKNRNYAQVLEEQDNTGGLLVAYVYGDDLISQERGGVGAYYHYDGLGSTRFLTDVSESITDSYTYEAFGSLLDSTGSTDNNYLFSGEQYDRNVGFYYLRARYYRPQQGRFLTMDTWSGSTYDPISLQKYLYANANPVKNIDPSGKFSIVNVMVNNVEFLGGFNFFENWLQMPLLSGPTIHITENGSLSSPVYGADILVTGEGHYRGSTYKSTSYTAGGVISSGIYSYQVMKHPVTQWEGISLRINHGQSVRSEIKNYGVSSITGENWNGEKLMDGIHIHRGWALNSRGSSGCITIHPDDKKSFFDIFRDNIGQMGSVTIARYTSDVTI